jgi:predicted DNA binding CopG/RHH family protein
MELLPMSEPKRGRPATERGAYNPNPARQLGRVSDEDWETIKAAAEKAGVPFTQWALPILLRAAKRQLGR